MRGGRERAQVAIRAGALCLAVAWLLVPALRDVVPWWLAFAVLAAAEVEFLLGGLRGGRAPGRSAARAAPGPEDADLGWGRLVEDGGETRWEPPPPRPERRRWPSVLVTALVAACLLALAVRADAGARWDALSPRERAATELRITAESARIAGRPVRVECDRSYAFTGARSDALGVAFPERALAFLHPAVCRTIHDLLAGSRVTDGRRAEALLVVAHEAVHLSGVRDEGLTECRALQRGVALGRRLGLSEDDAARLMRERFAEALAERNVVRAAYALPRSCVNGGADDLDPASDRFP